jgi:hypothetical protein
MGVPQFNYDSEDRFYNVSFFNNLRHSAWRVKFFHPLLKISSGRGASNMVTPDFQYETLQPAKG